MFELKDTDWNCTFYGAETVKDVLEVVEKIKVGASDTKALAFDFETSKSLLSDDEGVNPWQDVIWSCSFCFNDTESYAFRIQSKDGEWVYPEPIIEEVKNLFLFMLDRNDIIKIIHNLKFDCKLQYRLVNRFPSVVDTSWDDTMVMAYLLDENRSAGLKKVVSRSLDIDGVKYERRLAEVGGIKDIDKTDWYICMQYNNADSWMARKYWNWARQKLEDQGILELYIKLYRPFLNILLETEIEGFDIDRPYLENKSRELAEILSQLEEKMQQLSNMPDFNPRSVKQLREALSNLGLHRHIKKKSKTGFSTDKDVLADLKKKDSSGFVDTLLVYREREKVRTFADGLLERIGTDGRIRTNFLPHGTVTGRLSSRDPNFQNLKRGEEIRYAFKASDGCKLVVADFSQIELRVTAFYADDKDMLEIFERNGDIHSQTAITCFNLNCSEEEVKKLFSEKRTRSKAINFGIIYGQTEWGLALALGIPVEEARDYIKSYYDRFRRVGIYKVEVENEVINNEYVSNIFGRRRRFPGLGQLHRLKGADDDDVSYMLREAFNALIQGTAADICDLSIVKVKRRAYFEKIPALLLAQVHDEMAFETPEKYAEDLAVTIEEESENVIEGFKTPIDIKICDRWSEAK